MEAIYRQVNEQLYTRFIGLTTNNMSKQAFLLAFYSTLIQIEQRKYIALSGCDYEIFTKIIKRMINDTSLCAIESKFMKKMLIVDNTQWISLFEQYFSTKETTLKKLIEMMLNYMTEHITIT